MKMSMRDKYDKGMGVRLPGNQWVYNGTVYDVPPKGTIFRKATVPKGHTGHIISANVRQLREWMERGIIPKPILSI